MDQTFLSALQFTIEQGRILCHYIPLRFERQMSAILPSIIPRANDVSNIAFHPCCSRYCSLQSVDFRGTEVHGDLSA